jgi:hypothetical protein
MGQVKVLWVDQVKVISLALATNPDVLSDSRPAASCQDLPLGWISLHITS